MSEDPKWGELLPNRHWRRSSADDSIVHWADVVVIVAVAAAVAVNLIA